MSDIVTLNGYKIKDEKAVRTYESIADMKADTKLKEGYHVKTKGYYEANDGGHGEYIIVDDETLVDDGGSIHTLNNGLRAKLINNGEYINVNQFGCLSDGTTDNRTNIQNAVDYTIANKLNIHFNSGIYGLSGTINFPLNQNGIIIKGVSRWTTIIKALDDNTQFDFKDFIRSKIEDIKFLGTGDETIPLINIEGKAHLSTINNCNIISNMAIYCENSAYFTIENTGITKVATKLCHYLLNIKGEYFYSNNSYYGSGDSAGESITGDIGIILNDGVFYYLNNCDICNLTGGIGLQLKANSNTIKNVYIENTTFMRNNINIDMYSNQSISNIDITDCDFIINNDVDKIINIHRDGGQSGTINNISGLINLDGNVGEWTYSKEMFSSTTSVKGNVRVKSISGTIPDYSQYFPITPILNTPNNFTINTSNASSYKYVISSNSPFKDSNLPNFEIVKYNGRAWQSYTVENVFHGELSITVTYDDTYPTLYSQAYLKIKYFD